MKGLRGGVGDWPDAILGTPAPPTPLLVILAARSPAKSWDLDLMIWESVT